MAENLSNFHYPLHNEAQTNDQSRPGDLIFEYHEETFTIATNTADLEVPTTLGKVLMVIPGGFASVFATGDFINDLTSDGVITTGAVTIRINTTSVADGAFTTRFFLVGYKSPTILFNTPDNPA